MLNRTPPHAPRRTPGRTIFARLFLPVMAAMLIQGIVYLGITWQGGVISHADKNAYDILNERVMGRKQYVETEMVHKWSNLYEIEASVLDRMSALMSLYGADADDIARNPTLNNQLIEAVVPDLIYALRRNLVTGAFVVLDGPGLPNNPLEQARAGFYLRNLDPNSYSDTNSDLMVARGMPDISKRLRLTFDSNWSPAFRFTGEPDAQEERFFFEPITAARACPDADAQSTAFGYWSRMFPLNPTDVPVFTYSIPLILPEGDVVGVLGVDITEPYIVSLLNYAELLSNRTGAYYLGVSEDGGKTYRRVATSGPAYKYLFGTADTLALGEPVSEGVYPLEDAARDAGTVLGCVHPLNLYNPNTPFVGQQWALIGIVQKSHLLSFSRQIALLSLVTALASLALGLLSVYLASRMVTRPITTLVRGLRLSDPSKAVSLQKLDIKEIDELTSAVESLSSAVAESSSKISKILSLTQAAVGVFEYAQEDARVFCSGNLFSILGWPEQADAAESLYMPREEFEARLSELQAHLAKGAQDLYCLGDGGAQRWVRLTSLREKGKTLGAFSDVTHDVLAKQRIEYERDYDLLTHLYNRRAFLQKLDALFEDPQALKVCALVMWDLDNLKYINDTYGHDYGDRYIVSLSECLQFFSARGGVASRRSGDEFYIFLYGFESREALRAVLDEGWLLVQQRPFILPNGIDYRIRVSAGMAWYPDDATLIEDLMRCADYAMYSAKHTFKGSLGSFDRRAYLNDASMLFGQEALNKLIDNELVRFALQPIFDVNRAEVYGYELLMRPQVEELSSPLDVLRIAQAQAKLYHIERITWFKGMQAFAALSKAGLIAPHARAFINSIGSQSMTDADITLFEERFAGFLDRVVLEMIESEPGVSSYVAHKISIAHRWGGLVAIDDYGVGYNSEASLIFLTPDMVKLDMAIVRDIDKDVNKQNLLRSLINYAATRGITVLAEGVETEAEMRLLVSFGIGYLQGYYLARPGFEPESIAPRVESAIARAREERDAAR